MDSWIVYCQNLRAIVCNIFFSISFSYFIHPENIWACIKACFCLQSNEIVDWSVSTVTRVKGKLEIVVLDKTREISYRSCYLLKWSRYTIFFNDMKMHRWGNNVVHKRYHEMYSVLSNAKKHTFINYGYCTDDFVKRYLETFYKAW